MSATERYGVLLCVALLLTPHVLAQSTQPTLKSTMTFIADTLNNRGPISWTTTLEDFFGAKWTTTNSLAQVNADPSTCSLGWTSVEVEESSNKTVETYLAQLLTVSAVDVQPYSQSPENQNNKWKPRFSPGTYLVQIKTTTAINRRQESYKGDKLKSKTSLPNDHEANIQFADRDTAKKVADAVRHGAGLCGATLSR